jgi:hypothetical protein
MLISMTLLVVALVIVPAIVVPLKKKNDKLGSVQSGLDLYQASAYSSPCGGSDGGRGKGSKGSKGSSVCTTRTEGSEVNHCCCFTRSPTISSRFTRSHTMYSHSWVKQGSSGSSSSNGKGSKAGQGSDGSASGGADYTYPGVTTPPAKETKGSGSGGSSVR